MMGDPTVNLRWFHLTPSRLVPILLAAEFVLWLSARFQWFPFNRHKGWTVLIGLAGVGAILLLSLFWFGISLYFRRRFQFGIRTLFGLTVVVALPLSWLGTEIKAAKRQKAAVAAVRQAGGWCCAHWQIGENKEGVPKAVPPEPKWLRNLLGDDFFDRIVYVDLTCPAEATDASLESLKDLSQLKWLNLSDSHITDAGMKCLKGLSQLREPQLESTQITDIGVENLEGLRELSYLNISRTKLSDVGLKHLRELTNLELLLLDDTQVTDSGLDYLVGMGKLSYLYLDDTQVTDAGLEKLKAFGSLRVLWLADSRVTDAGVQKLRQSLPHCDFPYRPQRK